MTFIDNLAFSLFAISFAGFLSLYILASICLSYRRKGRDFFEYVRGASIPLGIVGGYLLIMGLLGQLTWPLPGSYNMLFYDPMVAFGMVMLSFAVTAKFGRRLNYAGFLGLLFGVMVIIYGVSGYNIGLTEVPFALLAMYIAYGVAGIFAFPVALLIERLPELKGQLWIGWYLVLAVFFLSLLAASVIAGYIGVLAVPSHLASPP